MSEITDYVRTTFAAGDDKRDEGLKKPDDIERFDDIPYGGDPSWQILDIYRPTASKGRMLPVIVSVHGGGWVYGNKERYQYYCMNLAQRGFAVVNFTYRLAPEHKFPEQMEDINLVFQWCLRNSYEYGLDIHNIFAVGDSAGAHLLGLYSAAWSDRNYASSYNTFCIPDRLIIRAVALNCGPYHIKLDNPDDLTQKLICELLPQRGSEQELQTISVIDHVTENFPPTFLMTAIDDFAKPFAPEMEKKLSSCHIPHIYRIYGDEQNRLRHVFHCDIKSESSDRCNDDECGFFMEHYYKE